MEDVYVYKSSISKVHLFMILYPFSIGCIVGYFNGFLYFIMAFVIISSIIFILKIIGGYSAYYDTITVDNRLKKLIFKSFYDTYEIFNYSEIERICFLPNDFYERGRVLHHIEIYEKSGSVSYIRFSWNEFSLKFLKNLPKSIVVTKLPPSLVKQGYYLFIIILLTFLFTVAAFRLF